MQSHLARNLEPVAVSATRNNALLPYMALMHKNDSHTYFYLLPENEDHLLAYLYMHTMHLACIDAHSYVNALQKKLHVALEKTMLGLFMPIRKSKIVLQD